MMLYLRCLILQSLFVWLLTLPHIVSAHDPGLSLVRLQWANNALTAHLTFARRDIEVLVPIDTDHDGTVTSAEWIQARPHIAKLATRTMIFHRVEQPLPVQLEAIELDASDALHVGLKVPHLAGTPLTIMAPILLDLSRGHRQYVAVYDAQGTPRTEHLLNAEHTAFALSDTDMAGVTTLSLVRQFLYLGVEHIVTGYDHLLFLFGLLVVGSGFWSAWRVITAFTVAHSLTLALATFDLVRLPPSVVEPLIAVSIVYVGLENLARRDLHHRWLLTFGFGLVHGLGFAAILRELGIGATGNVATLVPLFAFNFGVELGQVAIAALVLPGLRQAQRLTPNFPRLATVGSFLVILAGTYWLVERTMGL